MVYLTNELWFPPPQLSTGDGLLAVGGDLSSDRLLLAYSLGIFPWYNEGDPILWWSPDPRMVLFPKKLRISKSLRKELRKNDLQCTWNSAFSEVLQQCASIKRGGQAGTWITPQMLKAYQKLHELGHAYSVEVWKEDALVGGLYGIDLPNQGVFCGESMFSKASNASKVALHYLVEKLKGENYAVIDCQVYNEHLESLGAEEIPRDEFLKFLG